MSIFSRLFTSETKASRAKALQFRELTPAAWSRRDYEAFCREAYKQNVVAYQAVNRLATAISNMEWEVWLNGVQQDRHPLLSLIRRPNPVQSASDWWKVRVIFLMLSGNSYIELVTNSRRVPQELWLLRPDRMKIKLGQTGLPAEYIYTVGQNKVSYAANPVTGESDILHTKLYNPLDENYGLSPVEAAAYAVDQHNETMKWVQALLQNSARPSGALVVDSEAGLSDEEYNRLAAEIERKYSGSENAGRPMLLEGGLDWKPMGLSPVDMEILRIKDSAARDISLAFGVPPLLLNIPGDNTYANYREARLGFYEDTVLPLVDFLLSDLNAWLGPRFGGAELRVNRDKIEAIADKRKKLWEMADESSDLTLNESRALKGYDPLPSPLGNMLMSEVRQLAKQPAQPDAATLQGLAYGSGQ